MIPGPHLQEEGNHDVRRLAPGAGSLRLLGEPLLQIRRSLNLEQRRHQPRPLRGSQPADPAGYSLRQRTEDIPKGEEPDVQLSLGAAQFAIQSMSLRAGMNSSSSGLVPDSLRARIFATRAGISRGIQRRPRYDTRLSAVRSSAFRLPRFL